MYNFLLPSTINPFDLSTAFNLTTGELTVQYLNGASQHAVSISIQANSNITIPFYLDIYANGSLFQTWQGQGFTFSNGGNADLGYFTNQLGLNDVYTFKLRANGAVNITLNVDYIVDQITNLGTLQSNAKYRCIVNNLTSFTDLQTLAPLIKVQDFIAGILKQFNLTCYGESLNTFKIIPLADWYGAGAIIDITEFTDKDEIGISRVKLYKKIAFKFQDSEGFMNKKYFELGLKQWGNTEYQYPYDGGEFTLEVPFENMLFNKFTGTDLQLGYSLNESFSPYIPKPLLMYKYGGITLANHIHYTDGSGFFTNFNYTMFGQDLTDNSIKYSINFAPETSSYWLYPIQQSIFATYYFPYLANLFNPKNRLTTVKANLPVSLLTGIQLNDRVIIRDKRYLINQMKTNMVTGVTEFELLNDFMPVEPERIINVEPDRNTVTVPITLPNATSRTGSISLVRFTSTNSDVIILPNEITEEQSIRISLPVLDVETRITEGVNDTIFINIEYEYSNGQIRNGQIIILR